MHDPPMIAHMLKKGSIMSVWVFCSVEFDKRFIEELSHDYKTSMDNQQDSVMY